MASAARIEQEFWSKPQTWLVLVLAGAAFVVWSLFWFNPRSVVVGLAGSLAIGVIAYWMVLWLFSPPTSRANHMMRSRWLLLTGTILFISTATVVLQWILFTNADVRPDPVSLTTLALVVGTILLFLLGLATDSWQRSRATTDIAFRWNDGELADTWARHRAVFATTPTTTEVEYDKDELKMLFVRVPLIRGDLVKMLNHLDIVAMGYRTGQLERRAAEHLYGNLLATTYLRFKEYIDESACPIPNKETPSLALRGARNMVSMIKSHGQTEQAKNRVIPVWFYLSEVGQEFAQAHYSTKSFKPHTDFVNQAIKDWETHVDRGARRVVEVSVPPGATPVSLPAEEPQPP